MMVIDEVRDAENYSAGYHALKYFIFTYMAGSHNVGCQDVKLE